jgi:hypothetical protein
MGCYSIFQKDLPPFRKGLGGSVMGVMDVTAKRARPQESPSLAPERSLPSHPSHPSHRGSAHSGFSDLGPGQNQFGFPGFSELVKPDFRFTRPHRQPHALHERLRNGLSPTRSRR